MTYVIVQNCCNDASCVEVCPVDCIHPTPDEPDFLTAEMLYINPADCIDCGACIDACPVEAIKPDYDLPDHLESYLAVNEDYFSWMAPPPPAAAGPRRTKLEDQSEPVRVAVVGAGPSGWYVADELANTARAEVEVTVLDRLPVSHGLVRHGVAPDHQDTKLVGSSFDETAGHKRVGLRLGVEIGTDLTHDELLERHHAVVYCTGASGGRTLGIPGEQLPGVITSADFVHWYNGHPDHVETQVDLAGRRAVIIGNGNVALDIARLLLAPYEDLARTDIADHALHVLRESAIEEVVVLGRRGAEHAAFTSPELRHLLGVDDLDVWVEGAIPGHVEEDGTSAGYATAQKVALLHDAAQRASSGASRRLVLRFGATPVEVLGETATTGLRIRATDGEEIKDIDAGLVFTAIGYQGSAVDGVPFDDSAGRFQHNGGQVVDQAGSPLPGVYTSGWAKRGPSGVIGTNRLCAAETVNTLLDDLIAGDLSAPSESLTSLDDLLHSRGVQALDTGAWKKLTAEERHRGQTHNRPRIKVTSRGEAQDLIASSLVGG